MNELENVLAGDSAHASPEVILEGLPGDLAQRIVAGAPHTIYQELWHIAFWQQVTLDWVRGIETPFPGRPSDAFPSRADVETEDWGSYAGDSSAPITRLPQRSGMWIFRSAACAAHRAPVSPCAP